MHQSTFRRFAAKYYHFFVKLYHLIVSFWAFTAVVKLPWKFLTLVTVIIRVRQTIDSLLAELAYFIRNFFLRLTTNAFIMSTLSYCI